MVEGKDQKWRAENGWGMKPYNGESHGRDGSHEGEELGTEQHVSE